MSIAYYDNNAQSFYDGTVNANMEDLYQPFLALLPPNASILDAGCGSGRDSLYFLQRGYRVTAFDASAALVALSSKLIGQPVLQLAFENLEFENAFEAIWACASLLHVTRTEIDGVFEKMCKALKPRGIFYNSFKYGNKEEARDGRFFNCYDETAYEKLIGKHSCFQVAKLWITKDARPGREKELWLNSLLIKK